MITGHTRIAGVIGHPVRHSLSPALHNAGFASTGADWVYVAFDVAPGGARAALEAMTALGIGGLSVTMPHKEAVAALVHQLEPAAAALHSVNTVTVSADGELWGASTDGDGFLDSLAAAAVEVRGLRVGLVGAGGAARSIVDALARAGVSEVVVVNRTADAAARAAALAPDVARVGGEGDLAGMDVLVNATSVGMGTPAGSAADLPFDPSLIRPAHVVVDIVYHPLRTPLLAAAEGRGARTIDGLGMLVHQAARQQVRWTGHAPDPAAMRAAAERELAARRQ